MWLFTKQGAFSIVQHRENHDLVLIRAFAKADLERLIQANLSLTNIEIIATPTADYHYRIIVDRNALSQILSNAGNQINYDNFKNQVSKEIGYSRFKAYLEIHNVLKRFLEDEDKS